MPLLRPKRGRRRSDRLSWLTPLSHRSVGRVHTRLSHVLADDRIDALNPNYKACYLKEMSGSWSTEALPMRNSGAHRINNAVCRLDWDLAENVLNPPDGSDGTPFELCAATRDDWIRYVQYESQALGSRWMEWWDDRSSLSSWGIVCTKSFSKASEKRLPRQLGPVKLT
ncbi:hypothetical protein P3T76_012669 [Phytophthora citrophthora]|uniref:Uncharacterized protein n=1 Tax=Phytophthora citrophthora TaxID=4793 RepID=A0AAD9G555_9STRA|nr:hypothetical protein P3T76_012669 [Phytophthora citrophthora]